MINYNKVGKFSQIKFSFLEFWAKNKIKILLLAFVVAVSLLTGILTAVKVSDLEKALKLVEFSFEALVDGDIYTFAFFIKRFLSLLLVSGLLLAFALTKWTRFFGFILIGYRGFLISLNCTLIIRYMGLGGLVNSVLIILPCQLIQLIIISVIFIIFCLMFKEKKQCGVINKKHTNTIFNLLLLSLLVNIIELLLLLIFKATTILII